MSLLEVAPTDLAAVVTYLEMRAKPEVVIPPSPLHLERHENMSPIAYRALFRLVGSRWLWFSRLLNSDADLIALLHGPQLHLFTVVDQSSRDVGMLELDFQRAGECELSFVGLVPDLAGQGHGRWLLAEAVSRAWAGNGVTRVHVHTCTLDHPAALATYVRAGFTAVRRAIETFPDPRRGGILPANCAPQIPMLG